MDTCIIPNLVHFVYLAKPERQLVPFLHFAAVASAKSILRPTKIILHLHGHPQGPWWERIRLLVDDIRLVNLPTHWSHDKPIYNPDKPHHHYPHMADHIRMHVLAESGGIYLDMDIIVIRPVEDLRKYEFVMGKETCSSVYDTAHLKLGSAVIMAAPGAAFLAEWLKRYPSVYDSEEWALASSVLPATITEERPDLAIHIEPETSFYSENWDDLPAIFEETNEVKPGAMILHLWQNVSQHKYFRKVTGMEWARQNRNTLCAKLLLNAALAGAWDGIDYETVTTGPPPHDAQPNARADDPGHRSLP